LISLAWTTFTQVYNKKSSIDNGWVIQKFYLTRRSYSWYISYISLHNHHSDVKCYHLQITKHWFIWFDVSNRCSFVWKSVSPISLNYTSYIFVLLFCSMQQQKIHVYSVCTKITKKLKLGFHVTNSKTSYIFHSKSHKWSIISKKNHANFHQSINIYKYKSIHSQSHKWSHLPWV